MCKRLALGKPENTQTVIWPLLFFCIRTHFNYLSYKPTHKSALTEPYTHLMTAVAATPSAVGPCGSVMLEICSADAAALLCFPISLTM